VQGFRQTRIGNPYTGWEEDIITNAGIDASLFNNKLDFCFEWYKKKSADFFLQTCIDPGIGDDIFFPSCIKGLPILVCLNPCTLDVLVPKIS